MTNYKFQVGNEVFHSVLNYDKYASINHLNSRTEVHSRLIWIGTKLYLVKTFVRPKTADEFPAYITEKNGIVEEREETVVAEYDGGVFIVADEFDAHKFSYEDVKEAIDFAMYALNEKNPYIHRVLYHSTAVSGVNSSALCNGLFGILTSPRRMTVIETMIKTHGEKLAINSLQNEIEISSGKKAVVLSEDHISSIKTLKLDSSLAMFQKLVINQVLSHEQLEKVLQGFKYLIKFKFITAGDIDHILSRYGDDIVEKNVNLEIVLANTIKTYFDLYDISGATNYRSGYYYHSRVTIKSIFSHYMDAINMLSADKIANPKYYRTNDVERYHGITLRNSVIFDKPRADEFKAAAVKLRKLKYDDGTYLFKPFDTEEELFFVGQQYNNCLPIYRDKIIDNGAVLVCAYKKTDFGIEECPDFVFEVTPYLDVLEISTYNNEEVVDPDRVEAVRNFRKAKWYLLSKGRTVYREADDNEEEDNSN